MASRSMRRSTTHSMTTRTSAGSSGGAGAMADDENEVAPELEEISTPLSPARLSRQQEKDQLIHLNDRLAQYIDRVRYLESENQRLTVQIRNSEEVVVRERNNVKASYEAELSDARRLLDDTAKEKARLQLEADKAKAEYDDLRNRINRLERDLKESENRRLYSDSMVQDLQSKLNTADNQRKHHQDDAKRLREENAALRKQLEQTKQQLEEETLLRVDFENRLQSMREELAFNKQLYEQELEETRRKRQTEITEIGQDLEDQYQQQLQTHLQEMREQFNDQLRKNRREMEDMFHNKLDDMEKFAERNREAAASAREELKGVRVQLDSLEKERNSYEGQVSSLERKIKDLQDQLQNAREDYYARLQGRDDEIRRLRDEISKMMSDYQDLMDTKVQLDVEIEAYRRLLEGEESRLHLTPTPPPSGGSGTPNRSSERRGLKRKRVLQEQRESDTYESYVTKAETHGDVEVQDHDVGGMFVKLRNKGEKEVSIGGWVLKRAAGDSEVTYKFHPKQNLKSGKSLTVWGKSSDVAHSPPTDFVMKNHPTWPVGETIRSTLTNGDGEEVAWRESARSSSTHRYSYRHGVAPGVEVGDPDQRCSLM